MIQSCTVDFLVKGRTHSALCKVSTNLGEEYAEFEERLSDAVVNQLRGTDIDARAVLAGILASGPSIYEFGQQMIAKENVASLIAETGEAGKDKP